VASTTPNSADGTEGGGGGGEGGDVIISMVE